mgnify:CR=1 FL=1
MKGLELSEKFYNACGKPMLESLFAGQFDRLAVGLVGHGSECFGFDDEISRDHDFEPRFMIWLTREDESKFGFKLLRAYNNLPKTFEGATVGKRSAFGSDGKGVKIIEDFYDFYTGGGLPTTNAEWLSIPDFYLAEATNGRVFFDGLGEFTKIREYLLHGRPIDVRLKKLASALFYMAQSGQYNYMRCVSHGENVAAAIALTQFVKSAMEAVFLLNDVYAPYYKWTFRAMLGLRELSGLGESLEKMLAAPYDEATNAPLVESVCADVIKYLKDNGFCGDRGLYLEPYAYAVNDLIKDGQLRNSPIML